MADDPILKAIQGGGTAVADEEEDPILAAIKAPAPKAASGLRTPTMDEAVTGRVPESESATLPTQRAAKVGKPALPLGPPKNPNPLNLDATQVPVAAFPYRYNQYTPASAPPQPEVSQEEIAQQLMKTASPAELAARAKSGLPMTPEAIDTSRKAGQNFEDAMMTGPSQLNFPLSVGVPGTIPSGVVPVRPADIQQEAAAEINNPNIPKTQSEAFWKGFSADAIKNLNDMFLSPVGLTSSALGASETVAMARAGTFGGDALKLAQEYQAMRAAGASAAELVDVEKKMQQAILQAAKAQKVATAGKVAGQAAGGAFAGQGATNIVEGAKEKDLSKVLEGAGQTILGVAAGAGAARGAEESVRAETARRAAESVGEAPTAKRTQQVPAEGQQPPQAPAQPQLPKPGPVGAGESLVAEKPETLNAQVDALKNGTNKVVYFPKGTESIPAPPDNATVTVVKGKKPGAGTYYHTDEVTPEQIQKSVKDGTIGELLGHEQTKEEAHKGQPTTVVARDEQGIEQKASVVDASNPEVVGKQAQTLQNQFPQAKVSVEAPEKVIESRQEKIARTKANAGVPYGQRLQPGEKPAVAPLSSETPQVEEAPKTPERRQERNAAQRQRVSEMTPEQMRSELLTSKVTNLPNRRAFDEAGESGAVAMSDADGLKALNDKFGYAAGNELLKAKADALKEAGLEAYHDKGDEFLYRGKNEQDLQAKLEKAREILKNTTIEATMEDGTVHSFKGADFSYGTGKELSTAETGLKAHKSERESRGERARGELRGITEVGPQKGEVNQSEEATNVEHAAPAEAENQPAKAAATGETAEIAKPAESVSKPSGEALHTLESKTGSGIIATVTKKPEGYHVESKLDGKSIHEHLDSDFDTELEALSEARSRTGQWKPTTPEEIALQKSQTPEAGLKRVLGPSDPLWDEGREKGLTDEQLTEAIAHRFGIHGGGTWGPGYLNHSGGKNPRYWWNPSGGYDQGFTDKKPKFELKGTKLLDAAREILDIPKATGEQPTSQTAEGAKKLPRTAPGLGAYARAKNLGKAAFERGDKRILAHDKAMMDLLRGDNSKHAIGDLQTEWYRGWDAANLAAPVPEAKTEGAKSVRVNISGKLQEPLEAHETEAPGLYATKVKLEGNGKESVAPFKGKREEWSLTHAGTGLKVPVGPLKNLQEALDTAKKIASVTDWTKDFKNLKKWESAAIGEKLTKALGKSASMRAAEESLEDSEEETPEVGQGLARAPETTPQSGAPVRPPNARWTSDIGNIPGEAALYLDVKDDDTDTAKAAITEIEDSRTPGRTTWQLTDRHGDVLGNYSTPEEAAKAAEKHFPKGASHEIIPPKNLTAGSKIEPEKEEANGQATESLGAGSEQPPAKVPAENARGAESERATGELSSQRGGEGEGRVRGERAIGNERAGSTERSEEESPVPAERGRSAEPGRESHSQSRPGQSGNDYRITDADKIGQGSISEKYAANTDAIRVLKELEASGRPATPEEQSKLVRYSGWGWSGNLLNEYHDKWRNERKELQSLLTDDEYRNAVESTKNAHYTSPQIIKSVWDAVRRLGFSGGRVLEPSAGIGHFFGLMPNDLFVNSRHTAIELDTVSGKILKQLYQTIDARIQGFEKLRGLDNFYDLAISNVPFGDYSVHDPAYKKLKLSIHNYFIAKMLDKVRPGGLVAAITSHHTLDNYKSAIRQVFLDRGDLVGAIRLPADAFKENAGTEVTTDLLLFRKRGPEEKSDSQPFLTLKPVEATNKRGARENVEINEYFHKHPKMALGEHSLTGSMYGYGNNYELRAGTEPTAKLLTQAIARLPENVMKDAPAPKSVTTAATAESIPNWGETKPFGYMVRDGKVYQSLDGQMVHLAEFPKVSVKPLSDLLGIRNATRELFQAEAKGHTPKELTEARGRLNRLYDAFVKSNGFINQPRNLRIMSEDPDAPLLAALEKWDSKAKTASKADVFFKQTIAPRKQVTKVDRPEDSLPASLAEKGRIDFGYMSKLTGLEPKQLQDLLREAGTVFRTPEGHWEANDEYLSGDVRKKLREAEEAAKVEPEFKKNVEALKAIQPRDLEAGEISTRIGTPWIPEEDVAKFIDDVILDNRSYRDRTKVSHVTSEAIWKINNPHARYNEAAQTKWGTARMRPVEIFEDALNLRRPTVYDHYKDADGKDKSVVNEKETLAVREKLEQMEEAFKNWLFKDQERAERLVAHYNENYNNLVDRKYDGSHLTFPGMNAGLTMRPNQKNGIWRSLVGGNTLLAHVVGAGKTFTIVASAMEGRRLGLAKKPMVVVPNHLVEQWASDFLKLYPQARVLAATKEEWGTANRKKLMSRIATGEWDAVIVPHSSFTLLPVSDETYKKYAQRQLDMIEEHIRELTESEGKKSRTVKELAKAKARIEARMEKALNRERKDNTINFEDTGVDRLYVDEAHAYKNLFFSSKMGNINGIPKSDAQRSFDMYMKSKYITDLNNGSGVTFATGTPISNTMAEIYTMQRYMDEALLEQNGLAHFDSWAAAYGQTIQNMEVSPEDPSKFRISTRFAKFNNVAELKRQFRQSADVILAQDLEGVVKVPDIQGGKPTVIEVPASDRVREYIGELGERAKAIRKKEVKPDEDNMLKITSEGRKVALDYRSMFPDAADDGNSKISIAAKRIADIYHSTRGAKSTQAVMLDLMTPSESGKKRGQFNAYADLKNKLVGLGVPANEIQFIHDAKSDEAKQDLFNRVNSGEVAIILGSSDKMGVGTNIQERLLALHHLDSPWRPSDIEQREGRIVRQGNTNPVVQIYRYVTSGTFDAYMWSGIARKANFIRDMMQHGYDVREMEDVDGASLSYAEAAAIATGDSRVLEKVKTDAEVDKLSKLKSIHEQNKVTARLKLAQIPQRIESLEHGVEAVKADIKTRDANKSDEFRLSVGKDVYEERKDAGAALSAAVEANQGGERYKVGKYGGLDIVADGSGNLHVEGRSSYYFAVNHENPLGTIQSLEKTMGGMETRVEQRQQDIEMLKKDLKARKEELDKPFNKQDALDKGLAKQAELNKALSVNAEDKTMAGARPDQEFNENFKAVEPSKAPPTEAEDTDEENKPRKIIPRNPEAGFITGEALLSPFIALGKLVRRMLGKKPQPPQGVPNRPPVSSEGEKPAARPAERAGNIRLDKLNTPEDVLNEIRRSAKDNKNEFDEQRRGKIPFKQTKTAAQQLVESGMFTEKDLAKMEKGTALNAEELLAARGMLIASAKKVREAAAKLKTDNSVDNVLAFQEALMRHDGIQKAVTGAVAEAGRALSQQRIIANALKGNDKSNHERILEAMGGKELSEEAAKRLAQIPEDDVVALNNFLKSQKYWTTAQKIEAYWIANVLSSPRTPIKKVLGDVMLGSVENSRRLVDAAIDPILATIQGRPRETFLREAVVAPMAYISAIPEATRKASYILAHGFDLEDPLALETPRRYEFPGGIKNPFNAPGRALSAATKYFQVLAFQGELHAQAVKQAAKEGLRGEALKNRAAELIQNPNVNMMNEAMRTAEFQTYTEKPDALSRILMTLRDKVTLPKGIPVVGGLHPMRFVIPFVQIPYNLAKQSVRYSPLGFLRLNDFEHAKSPQATKTISRALIGSAIMALFAYLAAKKMMTGPAPKDSASRDEFYRSGQQPYSIKFGHRWVSYKAAGPFALNAAATVAMYDRFKAKESMPPLDAMAAFASSMGQAMLDESFLRGIKNLTDALSEPNRYASRMASGTFGGFVPFESALRTASDAFDPTVRNPQSIYEHILAGLPVVNKSVAPKLDVFGRPSTKEGTAGFASLFPGGFSKDEPKSDMDAELSRLHDLGMKNVGFAGKHLTIDNYKINLTPEEQQQYQKARGAYLSSYLKQTFGAPEYKQMTDQEKIEAAEEAIHQAGRDAHEQVGDQVLADRLKKAKSASIPRRPPASMKATAP